MKGKEVTIYVPLWDVSTARDVDNRLDIDGLKHEFSKNPVMGKNQLPMFKIEVYIETPSDVSHVRSIQRELGVTEDPSKEGCVLLRE